MKLDDLIETFQSNGIDGKELMYLNHENLLNTLKIGQYIDYDFYNFFSACYF